MISLDQVLAELRKAFAKYPRLAIETKKCRAQGRVLTRFTWRDQLGDARAKLADIPDAELAAFTNALLAELQALRGKPAGSERPKAKGAAA